MTLTSSKPRRRAGARVPFSSSTRFNRRIAFCGLECVWSISERHRGAQYAAGVVGDYGKVIALDVLPMDALGGVVTLQADFTEEAALSTLDEALAGEPVDVVLSDMAPNISGQTAVEQPRAMYLAELVLDFAGQVLRPGGSFLVKVFQGEGFDAYLRGLRSRCASVATRKPKASRPRSREVYLLARGWRV